MLIGDLITTNNHCSIASASWFVSSNSIVCSCSSCWMTFLYFCLSLFCSLRYTFSLSCLYSSSLRTSTEYFFDWIMLSLSSYSSANLSMAFALSLRSLIAYIELHLLPQRVASWPISGTQSHLSSWGNIPFSWAHESMPWECEENGIFASPSTEPAPLPSPALPWNTAESRTTFPEVDRSSDSKIAGSTWSTLYELH